MMIKTLSIEAHRKWKELICVALHLNRSNSVVCSFHKHYDLKTSLHHSRVVTICAMLFQALHHQTLGAFRLGWSRLNLILISVLPKSFQ